MGSGKDCGCSKEDPSAGSTSVGGGPTFELAPDDTFAVTTVDCVRDLLLLRIRTQGIPLLLHLPQVRSSMNSH